MEKINIKDFALNTFAIVLFIWGVAYIAQVKSFSDFPIGIILVYLTAFVYVSIACSILMRKHIREVCIAGGLYLVVNTILSLITHAIVSNMNSAEVDSLILSCISALGYATAIIYIGFVAEE